jgi:hypothetical protein
VIAYEYAPGIKINDLRALEAQDLDREFLAETCVKAYFQQILLDGFYHADPHPGNIAVRPEDGVIIFYDYGMVGRLPEETRTKIVEAFLNIINKRPDAILTNLMELDMLAPSADPEIIRQLIEWALDNYYDIPHEQLNFEYLTDELSELMYAHPFKLPANFTFMIRALITLEGVATTLHPAIQFMAIAVDYARNFIGANLSLKFWVKKGKELLGGVTFGNAGRRHPARVRLQHEEWIPLGRYVKAGLTLLGVGQLMMFCFLIVVLAHALPEFSPVLWLVAFGVMFYGLVMLLTLALFPSYKKPVRFDPNLPGARTSEPGKTPAAKS